MITGIKVGKYHPSLTTVYDCDVDMAFCHRYKFVVKVAFGRKHNDVCVFVKKRKRTVHKVGGRIGMSKDTVAVMEKAIKNGAMTIAVTNNAQISSRSESGPCIKLADE